MQKLNTSQIKRKSINEFKDSEKNEIVVILDNIRSMHNVGSVFRSADGFAVKKLYLCGQTARPPHREIQKSALGATESVDWEYTNDALSLIENLQKESFEIIGIEQTDSSFPINEFKIEKEKKYALIFGNEVKGVTQSLLDLCDKAIEIPMYGTKHSFNISVSVGIVLYKFCLE